jgi:hypothetical protein
MNVRGLAMVSHSLTLYYLGGDEDGRTSLHRAAKCGGGKLTIE